MWTPDGGFLLYLVILTLLGLLPTLLKVLLGDIYSLRTILLVAAAIAVMWAFASIADAFLIVFVGIFLALVFEYPLRFVMRKTGLSRGLAATITVLGTAARAPFGAAGRALIGRAPAPWPS